jgi:hypothetical protein
MERVQCPFCLIGESTDVELDSSKAKGGQLSYQRYSIRRFSSADRNATGDDGAYERLDHEMV